MIPASKRFKAIERRVRETHDEAYRVAFGVYLRKGFFPPRLMEIVGATKSIENFLDYTQKYNEDQPRVPAGNGRESGRWTSEDGGSPFIDVTVDDPPVQPVYPLETALALLLGGASAIGDALSAGTEDALAAAATDTVSDATADNASAYTQRFIDMLKPDDEFIGEIGSKPWFRELPGGTDAAESMFQDLTEGGQLSPSSTYSGTRYLMPDGSYIGYRPISVSGPPTIDVKIPAFGRSLRKLKFLD